jgi:hypothetical protein
VAEQQHGTNRGDDSSITSDGNTSRDSNSSNVLQAGGRPYRLDAAAGAMARTAGSSCTLQQQACI